jgi:hypothetical protein
VVVVDSEHTVETAAFKRSKVILVVMGNHVLLKCPLRADGIVLGAKGFLQESPRAFLAVMPWSPPNVLLAPIRKQKCLLCRVPWSTHFCTGTPQGSFASMITNDPLVIWLKG